MKKSTTWPTFHIFAVALAALFFSSCGGDELPTVNPAKNSFTCVLNGEVFTPEYTFSKAPREAGTGYEILAGDRREELEIGDGITIYLPDSIHLGTYTLAGVFHNNRGTFLANIREGLQSEYSYDGSITITELGSGRFAGTFDFITNRQDTVTNGEFDLELIDY